MIFRALRCARFRRLAEFNVERTVSPKQAAFLDEHAKVCGACRRFETTSATSLNMLRAASLEPRPSEHFDDRLLRRIRVARARDRFAYWYPGFAGAGLAALAIFAALQLVSGSTPAQPVLRRGQEALRGGTSQDEPRLILKPYVR